MAPQLGNRFDLACTQVVEYLAGAVPLGFWSVTRCDGEQQVYLSVADTQYGLQRGDAVPWSETLCQYVVAGTAPEIAPDVMAVTQFAASPAVQRLPVGAYVGIPIRHEDGRLFGTLCGLGPTPAGDSLAGHRDLLHLLTAMLAHVLEADLERVEMARQVEAAALLAETDALTGLLNRRGWDRYIDMEEERMARYGDPGAVLVLDLDGLKAINDLEGHAAGDEYIRRTAAVLRAHSRAGDVVARLGGDEFGIVAVRTTERDTVALQRRLEAALAEAEVACSVGRASVSVRDGLAASWTAADADMYATKARRRLDFVGALP